jgi:signal transduction histidine kinase
MEPGTVQDSESRLAEEHAALRRVAVLVARAAPPEDVFAAVSEETAVVLGSDSTGIFRFNDDDNTATVVARWGENEETVLPVGLVLPLEGDSVIIRVRNTGGPARVDTYANLEGATADEVRPTGLRSSVGAPIEVDGRIWGALAVGTFKDERFADDTPERLAAFAELASLAIASAAAREELLDSRARLVQAADAERRRLERNLHDGAQQRLVAIALALRLVHAKLAQGPEAVGPLLERAIEDMARATEELRELARGLHPALLAEHGLGTALGGLVERAPVPVTLEVPPERLGDAVEVALYYVVGEALTNVAKYAGATQVWVSIRRDGDRVRVEVRDDGCGGADIAQGGGLSGLRDRVEALRGRLHVESPAGGGTTLRAELPA